MKPYHFLVIFSVLSIVLSTSVAIAADHDHHDVVIGLTDVAGGQQLTLIEDHALENIQLEFSSVMGLYYGGQACWIPAGGDLHIMSETLPDNHYQLELVPVDVPSSVIAFENVQQILNGSNYALDDWNWENDEGWHFHNHINWGLDPAQVLPGQPVSASFKLIDTSGQYLDSDIFTVTLTAVPEPATLGLLGFGTVIAARRQSKRG